MTLPPRTKRLIELAVRESGVNSSKSGRLGISRESWQNATVESRRMAVPKARARGVYTDEDVFGLIS